MLKRKFRKEALLLMSAALMASTGMYAQNPDDIIEFEDAEVERTCRIFADNNSDGKISYQEAASVTSFGEVFRANSTIKKFNELKYFTGITELVDNEFFYCLSLEEISLPNSIKRIGEKAFAESPKLRVINLGEGVEHIEARAMYECKSLESITLPESVRFIGDEAFSFCESLKEIRIPGGVPSVKYGFAYGCTSLEKVEMGEGVANIEGAAFDGCTRLKSFYLPSTLTSFSKNNVKDCTELERIDVAPGNPNLASEDGVLYEAGFKSILLYPASSKIKVYTTPDGMEKLSYKSFVDIKNMETANIGDDINFIEQQAFVNCKKLTEVNMFGDDVALAGNIFDGCDNLQKVTLPYKLKRIGDATFEGCSNLSEINFPSTMTEIGNSAFKNCPKIKCAVLPEGLTFVGADAFNGCTGMDSLIIKSKSPFIQDNAFYNCPNMNTIKVYTSPIYIKGAENSGIIPDYDTGNTPANNRKVYFLEKYKDYVTMSLYWNCADEIIYMQENMEAVPFVDDEVKRVCLANWDADNDGVLSYDEAARVTDLSGAFKLNNKISAFNELKLFTGLTYINESEFNGCTSLTEMSLPSTIKVIEDEAFESSGIRSIGIPSGVYEIGSDAFRNCKSLSELNVADGNRYYTAVDNVLYSKDMKQLIVYPAAIENSTFVIPESVEEISDNAFENAGFESVVIPETIREIGDYVFSSSKLREVKLPESITDIEDGMFKNCSYLESASYSEKLMSVGESAFENCISLKSIKLPATLNNIGKCAFGNTENMNEINVCSETGEITGLEESGIIPVDENLNILKNNRIVYVPKGCRDVYKSHPYWSHAIEILEIGETSSVGNVDTDAMVININGTNFKVSGGDTVNIYTVYGELYMKVYAHDRSINLPAGLYIINGKKVVVR